MIQEQTLCKEKVSYIFKSHTAMTHMQTDERFHSGPSGAGPRRLHLSSTNRLTRGQGFSLQGAAFAQVSWAPNGIVSAHRMYANSAHKPPRQSHPDTPPHDPDRNEAEAEHADQRKFRESTASFRQTKDNGISALAPGSLESSNDIVSHSKKGYEREHVKW